MKKIICLLILLLGFSMITSANERKINCEIESPSAVTYYTKSINSGVGRNFQKFFVKYTDNNNNSEYWIKISTSSKNRFLYYLGLEFNEESFQLLEIQNPDFHQMHATDGLAGPPNVEYYSLYKIPQDIINKLSAANTPVTLIVNKQNKQKIKLPSDIRFTNTIQEIISLTYNDKDNYWQPNI